MRFITSLICVLLAALVGADVAHCENGTLLGSRVNYVFRFQSSVVAPVSDQLLAEGLIVTSFDRELPQSGTVSGRSDPNVDIDFGNQYVEFDFHNVFSTGSNNRFGPAQQNSYLFSFDAPRPIEIMSATIDSSVTTLDLTADDVTFSGNELIVNVESLSFDASTFARIELQISQAPPLVAPFADFDNDDDVDIDDVNNLIDLFRQEVEGNLNDFDLDDSGAIDEGDLSVVIETLVETSNGQVGTFLGDFDLDGQVNVLVDAFILVGNLGTDVDSYADGDANGDRRVDVLNDAFALVGNLGRSNSL